MPPQGFSHPCGGVSHPVPPFGSDCIGESLFMSQIASFPQRHANAARSPSAAILPELSVVIPTFKERGNIAPLIQRLDAVLSGLNWEAIFVDDDAPDGTADAIKAIAGQDPRIRCLRRLSRRGLAGACIEGMLSSSAPYVAVMDADLQHDENLLPRMFAVLSAGESDMVVGSRYVEGGSSEAFSKRRRFV